MPMFNYKNTINIKFTLSDGTINFYEFLEKFRIESNLVQGQKIGIITQLSYSNQEYCTLGNRYPILINESNLQSYAEFLKTKFYILDNWYKDLTFIQIIFNYTLISDKDFDRMFRKEEANLIQLPENHIEDIIDLPLNPYYNGWGTIIEYLENGFKILYKPNQLDWIIITSEDGNNKTI
jgi:hypothetical protein